MLGTILIPVLIYLLVPTLGVVGYLWLCSAMARQNLIPPLAAHYFALFAFYGAWVVVLLTAAFWEWSGLASLGFIGLLSVAPFVTALQAVVLRKFRTRSRFHKIAFWMSACYIGAALLLWAIWAAIRLTKVGI
jgi:hypothetical protein